ncbi:hypothetical protein QAD02_012108 [Eretmocerus hayati]|uniref:Uncharacterized protein n=1 Tax=Eretmocerus hayati TaxID=131215 RepID=A0ACC2NZR6_9HYME|nr:hypothetical protein QAD02_012108 [Eretmocerus hayati]
MGMWVFLILVAGSACLAEESPATSSQRPPIFASNILVSLSSNDVKFGMGVIIHPNFVLTVANNLISKSANEIMVSAMDDGTLQTFAVQKIDYYYSRYDAKLPNGKSRIAHNIAIIYIDGAFNFDDMQLAPASLPEKGYKPPLDEVIEIRGFDDDQDVVTESMSIIDIDKCKKIYQGYSDLYQGEICAESKTISLCENDLGSALITDEGLLVGMASWIYDCKNTSINSQAVFVDVAYYHDWINASMDLMLGGKDRWFKKTWDDAWWAERLFEEKFRGGDEVCEVGPKREKIKGNECYRACDVFRSVNGECVYGNDGSSQCICPNMAGDQSLYDIMNNIPQPNIKNPQCGRKPCE